MASAGERVHKLSAEAFSRLRNDHEQFLEAYEKPTQIYRFLHARHSFKSLFLHRNLSYMQHRRESRKKRINRLRLGDLLKYRRQQRQLEGRDLASQIKSDNFLKITFHDLERGIDFSHLLSSALTGEMKSEPPTCHTPSLMEVEVLLYNCHQHISEAVSNPCSSVSLGKFEVEYVPSKNGKISGCSSTTKSASGHTLTIPESKLVWRGGHHRTTGSLMLVFHARASRSPRGLDPRKKPASSGLLLHQPQLAKVSVEVNRINSSDIAQLARARQASSAERVFSASGSDGCGRQASGATCESHPVEGGEAHSKAQWKTRLSKVRERHDAGIVTELSLGTGVAGSPSSPGLAGSSEQAPSLNGDPTPPSSPSPSIFPRKGFTETSASLVRKLAVAQSPRNGLNGLSFLNGHSEDHQEKEPSPSGHNHNGKPVYLDCSKTFSDYSLTVSIPCTTAFQNGSLSPSTNDDPCQTSPPPAKRRYKVPARKRSEIQLLLDGDKPPEQRISAEDIPVFTAEDPANRTARQAQPPKVSWTQLGTGTRRIFPVEPFAYPVPFPPGLGWRKMQGGGVKRSLSESDLAGDLDTLPAAPPPKIARVSEADTTEVSEKEMERENSDGSEAKMETETERAVPQPAPSPPSTFWYMPTGKESIGCSSSNDRGSSSGTGVAPEGLFCAEMVVFDSRGECLLDKGEYSLLMQKCPDKDTAGLEGPPPLVTFSPLSWTSVFGASEQEKVEQSETMMLKFSLSWTRGPPKHRLVSELETALDLQRIRNDYFAPTPPTSSEAASPVTSGPDGATDASKSAAATPQEPQLESGPSTSEEAVQAAATDPGAGERERAVESESRATGETEREEVEEKEEGESADGKSGSKEDLEEYFTATEASASSSVADSTELAQCRPSLRLPAPPGTAHMVEDGDGGGGRGGGRIIYNFLYNNNSLQQTESRGDMQCPWCSLACQHLYSLLKHMSLCHPRFLYTYTPMQGGSIIDVHVNKLYGAGHTSMDQDPVERSGRSLRQRWKGPLKCLPCTTLLVERHEGLQEDLSEFLNDGSWKRGYNVKRQYYHSSTCLPMVPEEVDADSEAEQESISKWQKACSQKMIDEFTDVNRGEKEMMKLWNLFAMEHGMIADKQIPTACVRFTEERGSQILQKNHIHSFLAHLVSLCQFGLITPSVIKTCMDTLNARQPLS